MTESLKDLAVGERAAVVGSVKVRNIIDKNCWRWG